MTPIQLRYRLELMLIVFLVALQITSMLGGIKYPSVDKAVEYISIGKAWFEAFTLMRIVGMFSFIMDDKRPADLKIKKYGYSQIVNVPNIYDIAFNRFSLSKIPGLVSTAVLIIYLIYLHAWVTLGVTVFFVFLTEMNLWVVRRRINRFMNSNTNHDLNNP